jgi:hypothetical protein
VFLSKRNKAEEGRKLLDIAFPIFYGTDIEKAYFLMVTPNHCPQLDCRVN